MSSAAKPDPQARRRGAVIDAQVELIAIATAAGRGDPVALSQLVTRTSPIIWRTCAALVDRGSADDLTQDTYLRAVRSLAGYRGESDPTRWLLTIARRVCAEEISRRQRARATVSMLRRERSASHPDPAGLADLADALARLAPERREAFVLTAVTGLSYADAAALCQCPIGTIRSRVSRARADLLAALHADEAAAVTASVS
jgi:RNA polymerase sigma-70 factor (ECF subfamily)